MEKSLNSLSNVIKKRILLNKMKKYYLYILLILVSFASPAPLILANPSKKAKSEARNSSNIDAAAQEEKLIASVNQVRRKHRLNSLKTWKTLSYYAKEHSRKMANGSVKFGHDGFEARASNIQKASPCYSVGENVAYCYLIDDPLKKSVEMWMESPHHRDNILGDYTETGMGIAYDSEGRCYITQLFSKRQQ